MTVSFWLNQPVADDGSLKSNRTLVVSAIVVVVGAIVVAMSAGVVVVGVVVEVVATSDVHALTSEKHMALRSTAVRKNMTEVYHRFSERGKAEPKMKQRMAIAHSSVSSRE